MRLFALEIGNTRAHLGLLKIQSKTEIELEWSETFPSNDLKSVGKVLERMESHEQPFYWASVVPAWSAALKPLGAKEIRTETALFSFTHSYRDPSLWGVDRALACEGALSKYSAENLLVVQAGSATTMDALVTDRKGKHAHVGGSITPGVTLSFQSLASKGARLPEVRVENGRAVACQDFWGKSPEEAIRAGVLGGQARMIRQAWKELETKGAHEARIVVTGGESDALIPWIREEAGPSIEWIPDLVLIGMGRLHAGSN